MLDRLSWQRDAAPELGLAVIGIEDFFRAGHHALISVAEALAVAGGVGWSQSRGNGAYLST